MNTNYVGINGAVMPITNAPPMEPDQRKKLFGYIKAAWEASGSPGKLEGWRHQQQADLGIYSLSTATKVDFFRFVQHCTEIIRQAEENKPPKPALSKKGPAGGRPKGIMEWTGDQLALMTKVEALLADMKLPWDYADGIAKRMYGVGCFRVDMCDAKQMRGVITALTKRQQKKGGRRVKPAKTQEQGDLFGKTNQKGLPL